jgi:hypothetical protein
MVKVTLESLKEMGEKTFESLAQGMGANIAHSLIYSKSIKEAMKSMMESTLESLAAQAIRYAIFSTALGFTDLAEGNEAGAAAAFTAAAIWGSVGAAAAVAGRAMAGSPSSQPGGSTGNGAGSSRNSGSGGGDLRGADTGAIWPESTASGRNVTVNVWGHVIGTSGVGELCNMLTDAVVNSGHTLTAMNTTTGVQLQR